MEHMEQESKAGPVPLPVIGEMEIILKQRSGICLGCKWHPNVCDYCVQNYAEENFFGEGDV